MTRERVIRSLYALVTLGILALDQATKALVTSRMTLYSSVPVIRDLVHLTLVTNRGALFGLFHDMADPYREALFTSVPILAIVLIVVFQCRTTVADTAAQSGLALILGGALGNLLDRLRLGYVVDYLDVFVGDHHWPAFNVADASICIGVGLLILDLLARGPGQRRADVPPEA
jgi:signal peptidase II